MMSSAISRFGHKLYGTDIPKDSVKVLYLKHVMRLPETFHSCISRIVYSHFSQLTTSCNLLHLPSKQSNLRTSYFSTPRCGHLSRIASSSSPLPLEFLPRPPVRVSPFFVASVGRSSSGNLHRGEYMSKQSETVYPEIRGILKLSGLINQKIFETVYRNFQTVSKACALILL